MADLVVLSRARMVPQLEAADPTRVAKAISAASTAIERYCNRSFDGSTEQTDYYDGDGTSELMLRNFPIVELTSVTIIDRDGTEHAHTSSDFDLDNRLARIRFKLSTTGDYTYFPSGFQNVKIVSKCGYETIPEDVQEACVGLVTWMLSSVDRDQSLQGERLGDYSWTAVILGREQWPSVVQKLMARLRDIYV